jgi:periplasmic protein TonB
MNAVSLSLHDEMNSVFAQRTLKLALVLALHAAVAGLIMHMPQISAAKYISAHLEARPMEVSFVQMQPVAKAPQPVQPAKPHVESAKPPKKNVPHAVHHSEPVIPRPALAAAPSAAPITAPATTTVVPSPTPIKEDVSQATSASKSTPLIAAHVDANYSQKTPPTYPTMSRRLHEEGKVQLLVDVSPKGDVESILVKQSSGFPRLDDVALNTVRSWHFVPARRGDMAVADSVVVPILFKLND